METWRCVDESREGCGIPKDGRVEKSAVDGRPGSLVGLAVANRRGIDVALARRPARPTCEEG